VRRRAVSARVFLLGTLLTLLAIPTAAGIGVWFLEAQRQQNDLDHRLALASGSFRRQARSLTGTSSYAAFNRRMAALQIDVRLTSIGLDRKDLVFTSPSLAASDRRDKLAAAVQSGITVANDTPQAASATSRPRVTLTFVRGSLKQDGMLIAELYARPLDRSFRALLAVAAAAGLLLIGLALAVWLAGRWIVQPLRRLSEQVDRIAGGELALAPTRSRVSEIATVSGALSEMATALERTAEQDARVEEERRFLVTAVAHDLRTPLFSLRGYLEAIANGIGDVGTYLPRAQAKAAQLERLVGSLFAYARDEYLDEQPVLEIADLGEVVRTTLLGFEPAMLARGVTCRATGDDGVMAVLDRERIERVLGNLVDNALRYSPVGGVVAAAWGARDGSTFVTIADEGPGIDANDLPRIFEPTYRSDDSRNSRTGGAGLGLTIAKRLMEIQRGSIAADNRTEGGAVVTLQLPAAAPAVIHLPHPVSDLDAG
jgi:signal transduction histidine kinase